MKKRKLFPVRPTDPRISTTETEVVVWQEAKAPYGYKALLDAQAPDAPFSLGGDLIFRIRLSQGKRRLYVAHRRPRPVGFPTDKEIVGVSYGKAYAAQQEMGPSAFGVNPTEQEEFFKGLRRLQEGGVLTPTLSREEFFATLERAVALLNEQRNARDRQNAVPGVVEKFDLCEEKTPVGEVAEMMIPAPLTRFAAWVRRLFRRAFPRKVQS
jgi:hypothetical protein